jgi:hypothetical protein
MKMKFWATCWSSRAVPGSSPKPSLGTLGVPCSCFVLSPDGPQKNNFFILASENEYAVGSALKKLSDTLSFTNVKVYGFRKWLDFKTPNIHLLEKLNVKIISPFYFDYYADANKKFIAAYRDKFFTDPEEYAVAGFEQGLFFIRSLVQNKGNMKDILKQDSVQPLSNRYKIRQKDASKSLQNEQLNILYFEEGKLKRVD